MMFVVCAVLYEYWLEVFGWVPLVSQTNPYYIKMTQWQGPQGLGCRWVLIGGRPLLSGKNPPTLGEAGGLGGRVRRQKKFVYVKSVSNFGPL